MPIIRKRIIELVCCGCGKRAKTTIIEGMENEPKVDASEPFEGWIDGFNLSGNRNHIEDNEVFCSVTCLKKGIDEYFSKFQHINK